MNGQGPPLRSAGDHFDRFGLYERCVQSPTDVIRLVQAAHGGEPRTLAEDFCGSAAVSRAWVELSESHRAIAVDIEEAAIVAAGQGPRLTVLMADVTSDSRLPDLKADAIFIGNFSIGYLHRRADLTAYLRRCRERLLPGGVVLLDCYGGADAFVPGAVQRRVKVDADHEVQYTFQRISGDPCTGLVHNAMHFRVFKGDEVVSEITDAFVYHWRLWSIPELTDVLDECGFGTPTLHWTIPTGDGSSHPGDPALGAAWPENWAVCLCARPS